MGGEGLRRRLILHVGPGRTGTSALQTMFSRHVADLARAGVHFPTWPGLEDAAAGAVSSGNGQALACLASLTYSTRHYSEEDGRAQLRTMHDECAPTVLYSCEGFSQFDVQRLQLIADYALSAGFVTQAVYYIRDPMDYARSSYARWVESGGATTTWEEFPKNPPFDLHLRGLRRALGEDNVIVRDYDAARADLFGDFCRSVLGIERPAGEMAWTNVTRTNAMA